MNDRPDRDRNASLGRIVAQLIERRNELERLNQSYSADLGAAIGEITNAIDHLRKAIAAPSSPVAGVEHFGGAA